MKETTAVMLGFGAVALGIVAVPIAFFFYGAHAMSQQPTTVDGPISRAFLGVDVDGDGSAEPVPGLYGLLPLGMAEAAALSNLGKDGFDCARRGGSTICLRIVHHGSSSESWSVNLTFDRDGRLASRSGSTQAKSL